jgi:hypothetical protein
MQQSLILASDSARENEKDFESKGHEAGRECCLLSASLATPVMQISKMTDQIINQACLPQV